jgi:hypothetical protein
VSTRKLIIAALLCGMAIVVAFTLQLVTAVNTRPASPPPTTRASR